MDSLESLAADASPIVALLTLVVLIVFLVWGVFWVLMPFFLFGAWRRAKQISEKMDTLIAVARGMRS